VSDVTALRQQLARIDRHRQLADSAESARVKIRLSGKPTASRGLLGFLKRSDVWIDQHFTQAETDAIYDALASVRNDERRAADELEKTIAIEPLNRRPM
jgi:hypothetical protein